MKNCICILIALLLTGFVSGQLISLENASFEGEPRDATIPRNWHICKEHTTPDILPGPWGVYLEPYDGDTYVGLITRGNGTWESIGQRLSKPLNAKSCYSFSMQLAHSDTYQGYNGPIMLRIWGASSICKRDQLLVETKPIEHLNWKRYDFQFRTKKRINYLIIEAHYSDKPFSYLGNLLIDDISPIRPCSRT